MYYLCGKEVRKDSARSDAGFTLVELLIVVVIMPLIIGAIAYGLVSVFSLQNSTTQRLSGSTDLQKVSAQFLKDVQSSESIYLGTTPEQCGSGVQLLGLGWSGSSPTTYQTMVSYVEVQLTNNAASGAPNATNFALERLYCTLGNFTTPTAINVLSSDFYVTTGSLAQYPPEVCLLSAINLTSPNNCTGTGGQYLSPTVAAVTFSLYVPGSSTPYTMVASPRGGDSAISAGPSHHPSPITLLGSGCGTSGTNATLSLSNNSSLTINVAPGTGNGTVALVNCPASSIAMSNGTAINASGILTGVPSPTGVTATQNAGQITVPSSISQASGLGDPYQGEVAPSVPSSCGTGPGQLQCGVCSQSGKTYNCSAGFYNSGNLPAFPTSHVQINFAGGTTETVFSTDLKVPNNANATFGSGVYVFSAADGTALSTGTTGNAISGNGVLFYVPNGGVNFSNSSLISLSGIAQGTPGLPYNDGITIWLGSSSAPGSSVPNIGVLHLANNTAGTPNGYGGIYAPLGGVVTDNNGTLLTSFITASWASFTQNTVIQITY